MRADITLHQRGNLSANIMFFDPGFLRLKIESASGDGSEINLFVDSLAQLEVIADAIYHAKMDRDADAMQVVEEAVG
jgi:hypothetical protein